MGTTNPDETEQGTIRKEFAESIEANSVTDLTVWKCEVEISSFLK